MRAKIVVRILDGAGALLGWAPLTAEARGDQTLRATHKCVVAIEQAGRAEVMSYHWADLHVQKRVPYPGGPTDLVAGQAIELAFPNGVVLQFPTDDGPLPPVTVRAGVSVVVPPAVMGVAG